MKEFLVITRTLSCYIKKLVTDVVIIRNQLPKVSCYIKKLVTYVFITIN